MDARTLSPAHLARDLSTPWGTYVAGLAVRVGRSSDGLWVDVDNGFNPSARHLVPVGRGAIRGGP